MKKLLLIARRGMLACALLLAVASAPARAQTPSQAGNERAYRHLFAAFGIAWVAIFGYGVSLNRRFRRLEEQVAAQRPL